jgi:hypothetical protein
MYYYVLLSVNYIHIIISHYSLFKLGILSNAMILIFIHIDVVYIFMFTNWHLLCVLILL